MRKQIKLNFELSHYSRVNIINKHLLYQCLNYGLQKPPEIQLKAVILYSLGKKGLIILNHFFDSWAKCVGMGSFTYRAVVLASLLMQ